MNKSRFKRNLKFLFFVLLVCLVAFGGYYFITGKENPISEIIDTITEDNKIIDNYNGVYVSDDDLNGSKYIFRGCSVSKISNYILIMDDDYYLYRSSCMGTFLKGEGKVGELDIIEDGSAKTYRINYNDRVYVKDSSVLRIVPGIDGIANMLSVQPDTYQLLLKETEQEGYYYNLTDLKIDGVSSGLRMNFNVNTFDDSYTISFNSGVDGINLYTSTIKDLDYLPDLYAFGKYLAVIEKKMSSDNSKYAYTLKVLGEDGIVYNSDSMLPITIDNVSLTTDNSIYITFDYSSRNFKMIVGYDKEFCSTEFTEEEKKEIAYYEFNIDYLYNQSSFTKPVFSKIGYKGEGCKYINKIMEES